MKDESHALFFQLLVERPCQSEEGSGLRARSRTGMESQSFLAAASK
jgi:hypothetical protein